MKAEITKAIITASADDITKAKSVAADLAAAGRVQGAFEYVESASPISLEIELAPTSES
jgi:hypothetical protein